MVLLRLSAMGDILRALPAWRRIAEAFPAARIQAVVEDRHAYLLDTLSGIEPVVVHRRRLSNPVSAIAELRRVGRLVRGADVSLDFHGILKSALIPCFAGVRERWGDGCAREGAGRLQTDAVPFRKRSRYEQALGLAEAFGQRHGLDGLGRFWAALLDAPLPPSGAWPVPAAPTARRVLLVPGTSGRGANKRWPLDRWVRLANALSGSADLRWSLGPEERHLRNWLPDESGVGVLPEMPFWELASCVRSADRVIVGDTGLLHLAVLLGVQVTALMGPSDPAVSGIPPGSGEIVHAGVDCSPCRERRCLRRSCMEQLQVEHVLAVL
jgi:ADP-heptose:LPS heptosyltransferase